MDSLTHIALGACIGELLIGKEAGKRSLLYGAVSASLPDIDVVAAFFLDPSSNVLFHRGFIHSLLFTVVASLMFAPLLSKWHPEIKVSKQRWLIFLLTEIGSHLFLDAFNSYGIGWFEPFSHLRVAFNVLFVADPFFSAGCLLGMVALIILKRKSGLRIPVAVAAVALSTGYLAYALTNKWKADTAAKKDFAKAALKYDRYFTTPTPLNTWLWYVVAETDSGYVTGYHSVLAHNKATDLHYFPRNRNLLSAYQNRDDVKRLLRFSKGFYTVEIRKDSLVLNDLRFGQIRGWEISRPEFVFHYYVNYPDENILVLQRGRFSSWNAAAIKALAGRIKGK